MAISITKVNVWSVLVFNTNIMEMLFFVGVGNHAVPRPVHFYSIIIWIEWGDTKKWQWRSSSVYNALIPNFWLAWQLALYYSKSTCPDKGAMASLWWIGFMLLYKSLTRDNVEPTNLVCAGVAQVLDHRMERIYMCWSREISALTKWWYRGSLEWQVTN